MKNYYMRRNWDKVKEKCPVCQVKKIFKENIDAKAVIDNSGLSSGSLRDTSMRNFRIGPYLE